MNKTGGKTAMRIGRRGVIIGGVLGALLAVNFLVSNIYRDKTYPRTSLGTSSIGSVSYDQLAQKIPAGGLLPETFTLSYEKQKVTLKPAELGISVNPAAAGQQAAASNSPIALYNLFSQRHIAVPLAIDSEIFGKKLAELKKTFDSAQEPPRIVLENTTFRAQDAKPGHQINAQELKQALSRDLGIGKKLVTVPMTLLEPSVNTVSDQLKSEVETYNNRLNTKVTFKHKDRQTTPARADVAGWYVQTGDGYILSDQAVRKYIAKTGKDFGINPRGMGTLVSAAKTSVDQQKSKTITLEAFGKTKSYTYCAAVRGVNQSELEPFKAKVAETLSDPKGWSLDGQITYTYVTSGCDFSVTLTAPNLMPTFGAICDAEWSCNNGNDVVINYARWTMTSAAWTRNGGSQSEYRAMAINHETGHWLGFGHTSCAKPGALAAVMQQQSMDLQGCRFNAWPTKDEQAQLKQKLGL